MRKTLMFIVALLGAVLAFLQAEAGLVINASAVAAAAVAVVVYLFGEAKNDLARIKQKIFQEHKWKDPAFWISLVAAILPVLNSSLGLEIPVETIIGILTALVGLIFANRNRKLNG